MLPVVETAEPVAGETPEDRRKTRQVSWKEARLCLAHEPGSVSPTLAATPGGVEEAGAQGRQGVIAAGAGSQTPIMLGGTERRGSLTKRSCNLESRANIWSIFTTLATTFGRWPTPSRLRINRPGGKRKTWLKENRWEDVLRNLN